MPSIPGSGAISMSMFNTVLGRASNFSNSSLAGGSTPAVGSQFYLGGISGSLNQTAPHQMSEWYGYTTQMVEIKVYIKYNENPTGETTSDYGFYYALSSDGVSYGEDLLITTGNNISTTCTEFIITVPPNYYGAFGFRTVSSGKGSGGRYFTSTKNTTTCPTAALDYCGTWNIGGSPFTTSWSTTGFNLANTIYVNVKGGYIFQTC